MSLEDASALATACIYISSDQKEGTDHIKMSVIKTSTKQFEKISAENIANFAKIGKQKFPIPSAQKFLNLSIAIPDSCLKDESTKLDKSRKVSIIARACAIFGVRTIFIYDEGQDNTPDRLQIGRAHV